VALEEESDLESRSASARKERGAFYTPKRIASFIAEWAIRDKQDKLLDPGAGEGIFLTEGYKRLKELGSGSNDPSDQIFGVELDTNAVRDATEGLQELGGTKVRLVNRDFFDIEPPTPLESESGMIPLVDTVVGNPPYIRYHSFKGEARSKGLAAAKAAGVELTSLTSSWAPFIVHATRFLTSKGRLGMVVPAELLTVDYAAPIRQMLLEQFKDITIISFEKRVFPEVLEDTAILLADKNGGRKGLSVLRLVDLEQLNHLDPESLASNATPKTIVPRNEFEEKWTRYLLAFGDYAIYREVVSRPEIVPLSVFGRVDIGVVTGDNEYFILSSSEVSALHIEKKFLKPIVSGANHLEGAVFARSDWKKLWDTNHKCKLLHITLPKEEIKKYSVWQYLLKGEDKQIHERYKTSQRDPWYEVPYVRIPSCFLTYMSYKFPRLVLNKAKVTNTNTIHSVMVINKNHAKPLVAGFYNTLTLLSTELVGRSYGGGVLKLETQEAEKIKVPRLDHRISKELANNLDRVDRLIKKKAPDEAIRLIDGMVLEGYLGLGTSVVKKLMEAYGSIRSRRLAKAL